MRSVALGTVAVLALCLVLAWFWDISIERALLLAPVFVIAIGLVLGLGLIFWRAAAQSLRRR